MSLIQYLILKMHVFRLPQKPKKESTKKTLKIEGVINNNCPLCIAQVGL